MTDRTRVIKDILWVIALGGLVAAAYRLWFGLGATTDLSDAFPWGLWKVFNMVGGVALSTCGFTMGFLVYVLRLKRFEPFMKPAILIAFLGYGCSCAALLFDIGLPHRFWHPLFMWNINSFLFEVFWCVMLYFTITAIELAPVIFERLRAEKIAHALHRVAFGVVVIGISLSSLHHSSLGSLFLVTPQRLHPLWYTPWLPILYISSAIGAGLMVIVLVKMCWARWYDPASLFGPSNDQSMPLIRIASGPSRVLMSRGPEGPEMPRVRELATIAAGVLGLYLILKIADLFLNGGWGHLLAGTWESWLYLTELSIAAIVPVLLIVMPWSRNSAAGIAVAAASAAAGLALNRLDVGIFGYIRDAGVVYFPSLIEWMLSLGVIAAAGLVFFFAAEYLPIFGSRPGGADDGAGQLRLSYGSLRQLWITALTDNLHRISLIAVFVLPLAFVVMYPRYSSAVPQDAAVRPTIGVDAERKVLKLDGDNGGVLTLFAHAEHQQRLGDSASCVKCHHISLPGDRSTPCSRCHRSMNDSTRIFNHELHMVAVAKQENLPGAYPANFSCTHCHPQGKPEAATGVKNCLECHRKDMMPPGVLAEDSDLLMATPFREAMHRTCIACHETNAAEVKRPDLADCHTCHESLRAGAKLSPISAQVTVEKEQQTP